MSAGGARCQYSVREVLRCVPQSPSDTSPVPMGVAWFVTSVCYREAVALWSLSGTSLLPIGLTVRNTSVLSRDVTVWSSSGTSLLPLGVTWSVTPMSYRGTVTMWSPSGTSPLPMGVTWSVAPVRFKRLVAPCCCR